MATPKTPRKRTAKADAATEPTDTPAVDSAPTESPSEGVTAAEPAEAKRRGRPRKAADPSPIEPPVAEAVQIAAAPKPRSSRKPKAEATPADAAPADAAPKRSRTKKAADAPAAAEQAKPKRARGAATRTAVAKPKPKPATPRRRARASSPAATSSAMAVPDIAPVGLPRPGWKTAIGSVGLLGAVAALFSLRGSIAKRIAPQDTPAASPETPALSDTAAPAETVDAPSAETPASETTE